MYLQNIEAIKTEVWRDRHKYRVLSPDHQIHGRIFLVTSLLLLIKVQAISAPPTTLDIPSNVPATSATSSDDIPSYSGHYFKDVPTAAATIIITVFAAVFSYGLSVIINVFCPDQCDHRGSCAPKNTTVFCRRYKRTITPSLNNGEKELYPHQPSITIIGIPNGRPNHNKNVQTWLEQVDHTIGVPEEPISSGDGEVEPATLTYDNKVNQAVVDAKMPSSDISGNCANKEGYQMFVVAPATDVTNDQTTGRQTLNIETDKTAVKQGTAANETPMKTNHTHIIQAEINWYPSKEKAAITLREGITSDPEVDIEVKQKAWNRETLNKSSSSDAKESEPLLQSPLQGGSPLSSQTLVTNQGRPLSITLESIRTEDTFIEEGPSKDEEEQSFVPFNEDVVLKPPTSDNLYPYVSSMQNMEREEKEDTKDKNHENSGGNSTVRN
ncbi:uncharacterized protein LOC117123081 [Anneissia japonica]|uniref:uncharacterized protein LOC117123081 n=1 Tax=Anneissia japonica TaxID=1529436 RepID=UPI0014258401|nr:uncharacterized protein LOC117123081 [Anneissia japonica]XP_033124801.1 uncharacterized protein LOC117123081 [Anneissia japonica]